MTRSAGGFPPAENFALHSGNDGSRMDMLKNFSCFS